MRIDLKRPLLLTLLVLLISGCDGDNSKSDLINFVENNRQSRLDSKNKLQPAKPAIPQPATYQANLNREPFNTNMTRQTKTIENSLQAYPLASLEFVGTITRQNTTYAYIVAPDKMIYQVKIGDSIGDKEGKVVNIYPNQIVIVESTIVSEDQPPVKNVITLQLKEEP